MDCVGRPRIGWNDRTVMLVRMQNTARDTSCPCTIMYQFKVHLLRIIMKHLGIKKSVDCIAINTCIHIMQFKI